MANEVTTSTIDDLIQITKAEAIYQFNKIAQLPKLIQNKDIGNLPSKSVEFPIYPATTEASALTEGTDLTSNTALSTTKVTLTVSEVFQFLIGALQTNS